jgi:hypothetical protein
MKGLGRRAEDIASDCSGHLNDHGNGSTASVLVPVGMDPVINGLHDVIALILVDKEWVIVVVFSIPCYHFLRSHSVVLETEVHRRRRNIAFVASDGLQSTESHLELNPG